MDRAAAEKEQEHDVLKEGGFGGAFGTERGCDTLGGVGGRGWCRRLEFVRSIEMLVILSQ